eukprot:7253085-Prymnesium_polylepis.1
MLLSAGERRTMTGSRDASVRSPTARCNVHGRTEALRPVVAGVITSEVAITTLRGVVTTPEPLICVCYVALQHR